MKIEFEWKNGYETLNENPKETFQDDDHEDFGGCFS